LGLERPATKGEFAKETALFVLNEIKTRARSKETMKNHNREAHSLKTRPASEAKFALTIKIEPETVKKIKKTLGLTVEQFAELLGVSPSSIFRYESLGSQGLPQGALSKKLFLLNAWLEQSQAHDSIKKLILVKDGLAAMAGLLAAAGVMFSQKNGECANLGPRDEPEPNAEDKSGSKEEDLTDGYGDRACPQLYLLTEKLFQAFDLAQWPMIKTNDRENRPGTALTAKQLEEEAQKTEAEARIAEAEARKLEARAKILEAQAKIEAAGR
jgi:DNA-binding transcriptional regulator YiaG